LRDDFDATAYSEIIMLRLHVKKLKCYVVSPVLLPEATMIGWESVKRNSENVSKIFKAAFILN